MSAIFSGVHKMRKAAAQVESKMTHTGHTDISMAIFHDKCVVESMQKLMFSKREADASWLKWGEREQNAPVREFFIKMADLDAMSHKLNSDYMVQCDSYRKYYKHILNGDKMVDDLRKQADSHHVKTAKLQKQVESLHKSGKTPDKTCKTTDKTGKTSDKTDKKKEKEDALEMEFAKALSVQEGAVYNLKTRERSHEQFKYMKVQDAWKMLTNAQMAYHSQSQMVAAARQRIMTLYTGKDFAMMTPYFIGQAQVESTAIINSLAEQLHMPKPNVHQNRETSAIPGEPGGHDETYQSTYVGIPEMSDSSSDSPSSRGSSQRSNTSAGRSGSQKSTSSTGRREQPDRPLPPLPGESYPDEEEYMDPDAMTDLVRQSRISQHSDQNLYLDLVAGEKRKQRHQPEYEYEDEPIFGTYDTVYQSPSPEQDKKSPNYENTPFSGTNTKGHTSPASPPGPGAYNESEYELDEEPVFGTYDTTYGRMWEASTTKQDRTTS